MKRSYNTVQYFLLKFFQ